MNRGYTECVRWASLLALAAGVVLAKDPAAYSAQATTGGVTFAADYLVRSIPVDGGVLVARGYLVVEVAVFSRLGTVNLSPAYFSLRINGSKAAILSQQPFMVANSFDYRRADPGEPGATLSAGVGNAGVIIGGQPGQRPQTGDPNGPPVPPGQLDPRVPDPSVRNTPPPQRIPETPNPYLIDKTPPLTEREQVERAALLSGDLEPPLSGVVFFPYQGKPESIKSVELLYDGPAGKATLKLR